jgi:hypothetical protein
MRLWPLCVCSTLVLLLSLTVDCSLLHNSSSDLTIYTAGDASNTTRSHAKQSLSSAANDKIATMSISGGIGAYIVAGLGILSTGSTAQLATAQSNTLLSSNNAMEDDSSAAFTFSPAPTPASISFTTSESTRRRRARLDKLRSYAFPECVASPQIA